MMHRCVGRQSSTNGSMSAASDAKGINTRTHEAAVVVVGAAAAAAATELAVVRVPLVAPLLLGRARLSR